MVISECVYKSVVKTKKSSPTNLVTNIKSTHGTISQNCKEAADIFNDHFGYFKLPTIIDDADSVILRGPISSNMIHPYLFTNHRLQKSLNSLIHLINLRLLVIDLFQQIY